MSYRLPGNFEGGKSDFGVSPRRDPEKRSCAVVAWDVALEGAFGLVAFGRELAVSKGDASAASKSQRPCQLEAVPQRGLLH